MMYKYEQKLSEAGLTEEGAPLMGVLDAELLWSRRNRHTPFLERLFKELNISSLLFSEPREPYRTIIDHLCRTSDGTIFPEDCETRTFLHDLPVAGTLSAAEIAAFLKHRKCVLIPGHGIITFGTVSPEQAFITYSSVCFAVFVKFFSDMLYRKKRGTISLEELKIFRRVRTMLDAPVSNAPLLAQSPFSDEKEVLRVIEEAGKEVVRYGLVDSYFGNISYCFQGTLYISQTSSSLDDLAGCIDPCPLDGSSCAGITASSELPTHLEIVNNSNSRAILHGHPKFSVIISMDCDRDDCLARGLCHRRCPERRLLDDIPIVPGEVGTGPFGLCTTVPDAVLEACGAIVYGHGVFTTSKSDFNEAFSRLLNIENRSREEYFRRFDE